MFEELDLSRLKTNDAVHCSSLAEVNKLFKALNRDGYRTAGSHVLNDALAEKTFYRCGDRTIIFLRPEGITRGRSIGSRGVNHFYEFDELLTCIDVKGQSEKEFFKMLYE